MFILIEIEIFLIRLRISTCSRKYFEILIGFRKDS